MISVIVNVKKTGGSTVITKMVIDFPQVPIVGDTLRLQHQGTAKYLIATVDGQPEWDCCGNKLRITITAVAPDGTSYDTWVGA